LGKFGIARFQAQVGVQAQCVGGFAGYKKWLGQRFRDPFETILASFYFFSSLFSRA
jgi:hypothetical protein